MLTDVTNKNTNVTQSQVTWHPSFNWGAGQVSQKRATCPKCVVKRFVPPTR